MRETLAITEETMPVLLKRLGYDKPVEAGKPEQNHNRHSGGSFDIDAFLTRHNVEVKSDVAHDGGRKLILAECVFNPDHKAPDAAIFVSADGKLGHKCHHNSCAGLGWKEVREKLDPKAGRKRKPQAAAKPKTRSADGDDAADLRMPESRTDLALAGMFSNEHGENVRWCDPWQKWLTWDKRHWRMDSERRVEALAKVLAEQIWAEVGRLLPDVSGDVATELVRFAKATASTRGISNFLSLARSETGIPILPESLDSHPWLLCCNNGTIDLRTGELLPHNRNHLITKLAPHDYHPGAACPLWETFLADIFAQNEGMIRFLQRLLGSALVGQVIEHVLPIFYGKGANGKSVLLEVILYVLGEDYGCKAAPDLLLAKRNDGHPTERADLHGKRLIACVETEENRRLAEGLVKELTGGDTIKARRMREDFWSFKPSHTAILITNHKPVVRGTDLGIWRRLRLIPFTVTIAADKQDKRLAEKLQAEASGILRWLVDGCLAWQMDGLGEPEEVVEATAGYRSEMDVLAEFMGDCCTTGAAFKVRAGDLYGAYVKWCEGRGEHPQSGRAFGTAMTERGYERHKNNGIWYLDIGLTQ
ncbi:MAG: DUF5906 domain-containing protein [Planctomycetes bacterium]|nr:DUF5906 domain-containing protein [Planctomycetota bacterium]